MLGARLFRVVCGVVDGVLTRSADWKCVTRASEASLASLSQAVERNLVLCEIGW